MNPEKVEEEDIPIKEGVDPPPPLEVVFYSNEDDVQGKEEPKEVYREKEEPRQFHSEPNKQSHPEPKQQFHSEPRPQFHSSKTVPTQSNPEPATPTFSSNFDDFFKSFSFNVEKEQKIDEASPPSLSRFGGFGHFSNHNPRPTSRQKPTPPQSSHQFEQSRPEPKPQFHSEPRPQFHSSKTEPTQSNPEPAKPTFSSSFSFNLEKEQKKDVAPPPSPSRFGGFGHFSNHNPKPTSRPKPTPPHSSHQFAQDASSFRPASSSFFGDSGLFRDLHQGHSGSTSSSSFSSSSSSPSFSNNQNRPAQQQSNSYFGQQRPSSPRTHSNSFFSGSSFFNNQQQQQQQLSTGTTFGQGGSYSISFGR